MALDTQTEMAIIEKLKSALVGLSQDDMIRILTVFMSAYAGAQISTSTPTGTSLVPPAAPTAVDPPGTGDF